NMYGCPEPYIEWIYALRIEGWGWYFGDHPILLLLVLEPPLKATNRRSSSLECVPAHLPSLRTELDFPSYPIYSRRSSTHPKCDSMYVMRDRFNSIIVDYSYDIFQSDQQVHTPNHKNIEMQLNNHF